MRRLRPAQRGDKELSLAIRGTVWKPVPTEEGDSVPAEVSISAPAVVRPRRSRSPLNRAIRFRPDFAGCTFGERRSC